MRVFGLFASGLVLLGLGVVATRCWPYLEGAFHEKIRERRMYVAERTGREIALFIKGDPRFTNVSFYAWPMEGVVLIFNGIVSNTSDLGTLRNVVEQKRGSTPVKWNVAVSTNETR
jgi:hypothetical protein